MIRLCRRKWISASGQIFVRIVTTLENMMFVESLDWLRCRWRVDIDYWALHIAHPPLSLDVCVCVFMQDVCKCVTTGSNCPSIHSIRFCLRSHRVCGNYVTCFHLTSKQERINYSKITYNSTAGIDIYLELIFIFVDVRFNSRFYFDSIRCVVLCCV